MLAAFVIVSSLLLLLVLTCLEAEVRERLLARRGRTTLDALVERTGLSRGELVARATRLEDGLFAVEPELLAHAQARPLRARDVLDHPLTAVLAAGLLAVGLVEALGTGAPAWGWLAGGGGLVLLALVGAVIELRAEEEDDHELESLRSIDAALDRIGERRRPLLDQCVSLVAVCDQLETAVREEGRALTDPTTPFLFDLVARAVTWWYARRARAATREAEALARDVRELRDQLHDELGGV